MKDIMSGLDHEGTAEDPKHDPHFAQVEQLQQLQAKIKQLEATIEQALNQNESGNYAIASVLLRGAIKEE